MKENKEIIKDIPISRIKACPQNPRINKKAIDKVMRSIRDYGYNSPILVDEKNVILAGHTRFKALKKLGFKNIPLVIRINNLTEDQKNQYRIIDNKTSEYAEWDFRMLSEIYEVPFLQDWDFDLKISEEPEDAEEGKEKKEIRKPFGDKRDKMSVIDLLNLYDSIIVSFSGGKDSIAVLLHLIHDLKVEKSKIKVIHCHVPIFTWGDEKEYIDYLEKAIGLPIERLGTHIMESEVIEKLKKRGYPGRMLNWCNSDYKVKYINEYLSKQINYIQAIGNRAEESENRAKQRERGLWNGKDYVFPIFGWKEKDVLDIIKKHKIKLHHSYRVFDRYSCSICYQQGKKEWHALAAQYTQEYQKAVKVFMYACFSEKFLKTDYCEQLLKNMTEINKKETCRNYTNKGIEFWDKN